MKEGGDRPISEVGAKYVGRRGSVWEKNSEKGASVRKETHLDTTEKETKLCSHASSSVAAGKGWASFKYFRNCWVACEFTPGINKVLS